MREIPNNTGVPFSQKADLKPETAKVSEVKPETPEMPAKGTEDLSKSPSAISGRSLVSGADNVDNDVKIMIENPKAIEQANQFFDAAEAKYRKEGVENPYEKAAALTDMFKKEFIAR